MNKFFDKSHAGYFKHLCGEYHTSTAFATWLAVMILKNQQLPEYVLINIQDQIRKVNRILIFNHYKEREFALLLIEKC